MKRILIFCIILNIIFLFSCTMTPQPQQQKFVVSFDTNGGEPIESIKAIDGEVIGLPIPTKEGYYFTGWEFEDEKGLYQYKIDKHITFKAGWMQKVDKLKYTVSFDTDGGEEIEPVQVEYNSEYKLPTPKKEGYDFVGWTLDGEFIGKSYLIKNDVTFTAVWKDLHLNCYVVWLEMYNGDFDEKYYVEKNTYFTFPTPTKEGYTFTGWEYEGNPVGDKYLITRNISFRATWEKNITKYVVSFDTSGGEEISQVIVEENTIFSLPTPKKEGYIFTGWNYNGEGPYYKYTITQDMTFVATWTTNLIDDEDYKINPQGFNGQGMEYVIKVLPVSDYDPFDENFTGDNKVLKQAYHKNVENAYNIKIVYSAWEDEAAWGPMRVDFIKNSVEDGSFKQNNVFAVQISNQWIPSLVNSNCLAELYDMNLDQGIFTDLGYVQDDLMNEISSVCGKVYGYNIDKARPTSYIYYNIDKIEENAIEDPAEMWFKGEWTWDNFQAWLLDARFRLNEDEYPLDLGYYEYIMGASSAQGYPLADSNNGELDFTNSYIIYLFNRMKDFYNNGIQNKYHGSSDVSIEFLQGKSLLHSGDLWYLKNDMRFGMNEYYDNQFRIGVVPYPLANDDEVYVYTKPYTYYDNDGKLIEVNTPILKRNNDVLTNDANETIYGLDLSKSKYLNSVSSSSNGVTQFAIINHSDFNSNISLNIIHDLIYPINKKINNGLTNNEIYQDYLSTILDYEIDIDVVMSVQHEWLTYNDLMPILSMTVGGGSHFGPNGFMLTCASIISRDEDPLYKFNEIKDVYKNALKELGY